MDLSKYIDKTIRVKFQGGREGELGPGMGPAPRFGVFPRSLLAGFHLLRGHAALFHREVMGSGCSCLLLLGGAGAKLIFNVNPLAAILSLCAPFISCLQLSCFFCLLLHIARVH